MQLIINSLCVLCLSLLFSCKSNKTSVSTANISIRVTYMQPYCNGAPPTPEMEKDAQTPHALENQNVYIKGIGSSYNDSVRTNTEGVIKKSLADGTYIITEGWRYYQGTYDGSDMERFDLDCMKEEWKLSFIEIKVENGILSIIKNDPFLKFCDYTIPCLKPSRLPPIKE